MSFLLRIQKKINDGPKSMNNANKTRHDGEPNNGPINGLAVWEVKQRKTAGERERERGMRPFEAMEIYHRVSIYHPRVVPFAESTGSDLLKDWLCALRVCGLVCSMCTRSYSFFYSMIAICRFSALLVR